METPSLSQGPSGTESHPESLADMTPAQMNEALRELTREARAAVGSRPSRSWSGMHFEIEGVACTISVELGAFVASLDEPGMPSGWRFKLEATCVARLDTPGRGAVFEGESSVSQVATDPHARLASGCGAKIINNAMNKALHRLRHHQAFTTWREAAALEAILAEVQDAAPGAPSAAKRL